MAIGTELLVYPAAPSWTAFAWTLASLANAGARSSILIDLNDTLSTELEIRLGFTFTSGAPGGTELCTVWGSAGDDESTINWEQATEFGIDGTDKDLSATLPARHNFRLVHEIDCSLAVTQVVEVQFFVADSPGFKGKLPQNLCLILANQSGMTIASLQHAEYRLVDRTVQTP